MNAYGIAKKKKRTEKKEIKKIKTKKQLVRKIHKNTVIQKLNA
jgi:hypothetical protein